MPLVIPVAHDFNCPWCWIALSQVKRLRAEFEVEFDWRGYELFPEDMVWPESGPSAPKPENKPPVPSRFDLALAAEGLPKLTSKRPGRMKTFRAHQAVEFARDLGRHNELIERIYIAHWQHGLNINEVATLRLLATGLVDDLDEMERAIEERRHRDRLVMFDDDAYSAGVYNVPTFFVGEDRLAEQPYSVLREALLKVAPAKVGPAWGALAFLPAPSNRPTVIMNMVSTLDGKILTGERDEPVMDLGSEVDHATMRYLESLAQGVLIGAGSLRATPGLWYPKELFRFVATQSGRLDFSSRFFADAHDRAVVISPQRPDGLPDRVRHLRWESWPQTLQAIAQEFGIQLLLAEGGSELNAQLLAEDLVDELFLTLAPKIKLGREVPTMADGVPLAREAVQPWRLADQKRVGDELFLRYRRQRA